jgi:pimeloyl-ACP methyl ester carboxylesterase
MIAQELAISYPERVKKLVLVCTTAGVLGIDERLMHQETLGIGDGSSEADIEHLDVATTRKLMINIVSLAFNKRLFKLMLAIGSRFYFSPGRVEGILEQLQAVADYSALDRLGHIAAPTLVIVGTEDRIIPYTSSEVLADRIPGARLVKVDGGSHAFFIEMSGAFNREVLDFLMGG